MVEIEIREFVCQHFRFGQSCAVIARSMAGNGRAAFTVSRIAWGAIRSAGIATTMIDVHGNSNAFVTIIFYSFDLAWRTVMDWPNPSDTSVAEAVAPC